MIAEKDKVVYLDMDVYEGTDRIESTEDSELFTYVHGSGSILPLLEQAIDSHSEGYESEIILSPKDAFGERDEELVTTVPLSNFPKEQQLIIGDEYQTSGPNGNMFFTIKDVNDDGVILDGNHVHAGKTLSFHFMINTIKDAHPDEIKHGRVHPAGHNIMVEDSSWVEN